MVLPVLPDDLDLGEYGKPFDNVNALAAYLLSEENLSDPSLKALWRHIALSTGHHDEDATYFIQVMYAFQFAGLEASINAIWGEGRTFGARWCVARAVMRTAAALRYGRA